MRGALSTTACRTEAHKHRDAGRDFTTRINKWLYKDCSGDGNTTHIVPRDRETRAKA